jgi:hypothetical protein
MSSILPKRMVDKIIAQAPRGQQPQRFAPTVPICCSAIAAKVYLSG